MAIKLARNVIPAGFQPSEFRYQGRAASAQESIGADIGIVEMAPATRTTKQNSDRYFHIGVVAARMQWFVYIEWGAAAPGQSWIGDQPKAGLEFMFVRCRDEAEARAYFRQECLRMQLQQRYVMQAPTGDRGLAQVGNDDTHLGIEVVELPEPSPRLYALAEKLVRGTLLDARTTLRERGGLMPTPEAIEQLGEELLPLVVERLTTLAAVEQLRSGQARGRWIDRRAQIGLVAAS